MHSPVLFSKPCLFLCLLALFSDYKLDISHGMFHRHFKLPMSYTKCNIFLSLPFLSPPSFPSLQLCSVMAICIFSNYPNSKPCSHLFCHLRNLGSQSSVFIHSNIILNATECQSTLQVLSPLQTYSLSIQVFLLPPGHTRYS